MLLMVVQAVGVLSADIRGDWMNQARTAVVRIADCGPGLCGTIIWSAPRAQRDARRGGTVELNGTVVMTGFVLSFRDGWRGRLFLPDRNRTVEATIQLRDKSALEVRACELGGLVCKSQAWTRVQGQ
jgi:uncharacterized protein (DUF2147 family)